MKQRARAFMRITSTLKLLAAVQHISSHPIVSINEKNMSSHRQAHPCGMYAAAPMIFSAISFQELKRSEESRVPPLGILLQK